MNSLSGIRKVFNRMGFNDQEIVALSGAHALGRCHASASGYNGPWTPTPTKFNNLYFSLLVNLKWAPNQKVLDQGGKFQYQVFRNLCYIHFRFFFSPCLMFGLNASGSFWKIDDASV